MNNPFLANTRRVYKDSEFLEGANELLREQLYPAMHEEARLMMHDGRVCLLRHILDSHLLLTENDPAGLKLYVAPPGEDRHKFENEFSQRDFIHPDYYAVIADPARKTIRLEYSLGGFMGDTVVYYEANINEFDVSRLKTGFAEFCSHLPAKH